MEKIKFIRSLFYLLIFLLTLYVLYLGAVPVFHRELNFFNDLGRDFLILQEIAEKKIIFIGARSSTEGVFHGTFWYYLNYPAYLIGKGNPVILSWFWIFLEVAFLISSFFIVKRIFNKLVAAVFILLISTRITLHMNGIIHAEAAFFFTPIFYYTIYKYINSKKNIYLILHLICITVLIQLNIGVGVQFLILSSLPIIIFIIRNKLWKHVLSFLVLPVFLINFILFDIRHEFRMIKALFLTGESSKFFVYIPEWIQNRIDNIISLKLFEADRNNNLISYIIFCAIIIFTIQIIRKKSKYRSVYLLFIFYYYGSIALSYFNKGILLFHYTYLLVPLTTLWLVSFLSSKYKWIFLPIIIFVFISNIVYVQGNIYSQLAIIGKSANSWVGLTNVASKVVNIQKDKEFGYYVFSPDAYAYQERYSMLYNFKALNARAFEYTKKPVTYIIAAPPPSNDPYMTYVWWRINKVRIAAKPVQTVKFPNGFTVEKYILNEEERKIVHDKTIELGLHFR